MKAEVVQPLAVLLVAILPLAAGGYAGAVTAPPPEPYGGQAALGAPMYGTDAAAPYPAGAAEGGAGAWQPQPSGPAPGAYGGAGAAYQPPYPATGGGWASATGVPATGAPRVVPHPATLKLYETKEVCGGKVTLADAVARDAVAYLEVAPLGQPAREVKVALGDIRAQGAPLSLHYGTFELRVAPDASMTDGALDIVLAFADGCQAFPPPGQGAPGGYQSGGWPSQGTGAMPGAGPGGPGGQAPPDEAMVERDMGNGFVGVPMKLSAGGEPFEVCGSKVSLLGVDATGRLKVRVVDVFGKPNDIGTSLAELKARPKGSIGHFGSFSLHLPTGGGAFPGGVVVLAAVKRTDCRAFPQSDLEGLEGLKEPEGGPGAGPVGPKQGAVKLVEGDRLVVALDVDQWVEVCAVKLRFSGVDEAEGLAFVEVDTGIRKRKVELKEGTFHDEGGLEATDAVQVGAVKLAALKRSFLDGSRIELLVWPDQRCLEEARKGAAQQPPGPGPGGQPGPALQPQGPKEPSRMKCCQPRDRSRGGACVVPSKGRCPAGFQELPDEWVDPADEFNCIASKGERRPFCRISPSAEAPRPECGDGACTPPEDQERCCRDCGCPEGRECMDGRCEGARPPLPDKCAAVCAGGEDREVCSFACAACPECAEARPPWPCLASCLERETGVGIKGVCARSCAAAKDAKSCEAVCASCPRCLFTREMGPCLVDCSRERIEGFAAACDRLCEAEGPGDVCPALCRECRQCIATPDRSCARDCTAGRREAFERACGEACADRGPGCLGPCMRCQRCAARLDAPGELKGCLGACLDAAGLRRRMLELERRLDDEETARKLLVAAAVDRVRQERLREALERSRRSLARERLDEAKDSIDALERQVAELRDLQMKVTVLERRVARVERAVERPALKQHIAKLVKDIAAERGEAIEAASADAVANRSEEVAAADLGVTMEAELVEVGEGEGRENVSVFTMTVTNTRRRNLTDLTLIQSIPKSISANASELVFSGPVRIIEEDPIVGWDLSMLESEEERKLRFSTKEAVDLDAVGETSAAAVKVASEAAAAKVQEEVAARPGDAGVGDAKRAIDERVQGGAPAASAAPAGEAPAPSAAAPSSTWTMPDVRGVLLVALAVVVLLAMMRTGLSAGPDEVVTKAERERLEEAFGHAGGGDAGGGSEPDEGDADAGEGSGGPAEADAGEEEAPPPKPAQRRRKA